MESVCFYLLDLYQSIQIPLPSLFYNYWQIFLKLLTGYEVWAVTVQQNNSVVQSVKVLAS